MAWTRMSAVLSDDGQYRYQLERTWGFGDAVTFVMLNPSTADARKDDPTIRRCLSYARSWGYDGIRVVNLYALRSSDPKMLKTVADPLGPENDAWIAGTLSGSNMVVAAWGELASEERVQEFLQLVPKGMPIHALKTISNDMPGHPLRLAAGLKPFVWRGGNALSSRDVGGNWLIEEVPDLPLDPIPEI